MAKHHPLTPPIFTPCVRPWEKADFVMQFYDYTLAELENLYREVHPDAPRSEVRREAKAEYRRRSEAAPHLILDIHSLKDPTCGEAEFNIRTETNNRAAARRVQAKAVV